VPIASRNTPPSFFSRGTRRSQSFKELKLRPGENLKMYMLIPDSESSPYPGHTDPLSPGESQSLIDAETGISMPYTVDVGFNWKIMRLWSAGTNSHRGRLYVDGNYTNQFLKGDYDIYYEQEIEEFHIGYIDPDFSDSHTVELRAINDGTDDLEGYFAVHALEISKGTPSFPNTKTVECRNCGNQEEVDRKTTKWECPNCGALNRYLSLRRG